MPIDYNSANIHVLEQQPSLAALFLSELRDKEIQQDRLRFRRNIERIGEIIASEISRSLSYNEHQVQTSLGIKKTIALATQPVIATILRAGIPFQNGLMNYFDQADAAFVSAFRKHTANNEIEIVTEYLATPSLEGRTLILADPMLATGKSLLIAYRSLINKGGMPEKTVIAAVIASTKGVQYLQEYLPDAVFWLGALDDELNDHQYIVPGLGDAGDLSYGEKI